MRPWQNDPLLKVEHLTMRFGGLVAINDLSFTAKAGEITAIIGPNGAGKTTVFNCITGFYKPTTGRIGLIEGNVHAGILQHRGEIIGRMAKHAILRIDETDTSQAFALR